MFLECFTFDKLLTAHKQCRRNKQHKKDTISFEINLSQNLTTISKQLSGRTYKLGYYKSFKIYEPKERIIEALSYKDRIVLHAFCKNIFETKLEKCLIYDNVACRKGKGTYFGVKRLHKFLKDYYRKFGENGYFLKCDIKKYFQNINHAILLEKLSKTSLDDYDLWFVKLILDSKNAESGVGLPIGNQTSQWFGLFYLNTIDRLIKEKLQIKYYVRYMDDMILIHNDKNYLKHCREEIEKCAEHELNLSLNSKTQIGQLSEGIDFLGFRHILGKNGKILSFLRMQAKYKMKRKLKYLGKLNKAEAVDKEFISMRTAAFHGHLCHSNTKKLYYRLICKYNLKDFL